MQWPAPVGGGSSDRVERRVTPKTPSDPDPPGTSEECKGLSRSTWGPFSRRPGGIPPCHRADGDGVPSTNGLQSAIILSDGQWPEADDGKAGVMTRDEGKAVRVVILELEGDDYKNVYVRLHEEARVVEIFTLTAEGGPGDLVATAPIDNTLIEWTEGTEARYPAQR